MGLSGSLEPNMLTQAAYEERPSLTFTTLFAAGAGHALRPSGQPTVPGVST